MFTVCVVQQLLSWNAYNIAILKKRLYIYLVMVFSVLGIVQREIRITRITCARRVIEGLTAFAFHF